MKWTKKYRKQYDSERYIEQKDKKVIQARARRDRLREWILEVKKSSKCARCPENHPSCLVFHHLSNKKFNISDAVRLGYGKETVAKELLKCEILCANCHSKEHWTE